MRKTLLRFFFIVGAFLATAKLTHMATAGFRVEKTRSTSPFCKSWQVHTPPSSPAELKQKFTFLGSGVQCYAFLGEDQTTVLKVFKHYHFGLSNQALQALPFPKFFKKRIFTKRFQRMQSIFSSAKIAYQTLSKQTGVFHLNLNPTNHLYPQVYLYDKIGIQHTLDLNNTPFLLQKKAKTFLLQEPKDMKLVIDALFACLKNRLNQGIANTDLRFYRNLGWIDDAVVEIDIGSFTVCKKDKAEELALETAAIRTWIEKKHPAFISYFKQKQKEAF